MLKRISVPALLVFSAAAFFGFRSLSGQETSEAYAFGRAAQQGQSISPVPLSLTGRRSQLVYLGSYIVNAQTSCNSCHTCPSYRGIDPYKVGGQGLGNGPTPVNSANFLSGGTPFASGAIVSSNLTPDASGKPGGLTYAQFRNAMRNGVSAHNAGHILQIMPWPVYRNLDENDMRAVYAYLSSIPTVPSGAGGCTGPDQAR